MFRYEKFYDIYEKTTKDSSGEIVNSGDIYFNKKTEDEIKEILLSFVKEDFKHRALAVASSEFNITQIGEPRILIIEDNQIIGVIFRSINQTSDYKFDIFIKENKRRLGYSKILLDAMLNDFIDNFPRDKQITAEVHNKELLKYIKDKYGFTCKNKKDYYGEDVVFYNLINESYYNVKDCVLTRQKVEKYLSNPDIRYAKGGELSNDEKKETYKKWKSLVNMTYTELKKFYDSQEGKDAGLTTEKAKELGIKSGRESAKWIMKMLKTDVKDWTPTMWEWANRQISFISRMSGTKWPLYDEDGNKTRKHTSLLIWGNNPEKANVGLLVAQYAMNKKQQKDKELSEYKSAHEGLEPWEVEAKKWKH
jgi:hypothetical protein